MGTEWQRNYVTLEGGDRIRYSLAERDGSSIYFVSYKGPQDRRRERSTGSTRKPDAIESAHRIIKEDYEGPALAEPVPEKPDWAVARARLKPDGQGSLLARLPQGGVYAGGRRGRPPQASRRGFRRDRRDHDEIRHGDREEADCRRRAGWAGRSAVAHEKGGWRAESNPGGREPSRGAIPRGFSCASWRRGPPPNVPTIPQHFVA